MAVQTVPFDSGTFKLGFRYIALTSDTLPTTSAVNLGDKAIITDGPNKIYDGANWQSDAGEALGSVTVADGGDVTQGAIADAIVAAGAAGTISAKLRRLTTDISSALTAIAALVQKTDTQATTATVTQQADQATNVTLQAANASRKGLSIFNDSTEILYIKFGATATTTSYTVKIAAQGYWELPRGNGLYTGIIDGIWANNGSGFSYATEW